ncbi:endogenous retrovirus group K member 24 Gag polyprotein-like [Suncus etruscus]|uniref:endogenous retrovirus group K member 24 Gag polyprotein-like n=1 Tax=Suncus etruscus TaxID=109475 RepID=UPI00211084E0|nr:endogenous retrovirus group K member 24 Gag polyprotein-like [Suncus etruscus]
MGATLSTKLKFIRDIQSELKSRHVEVTKKDICNFLMFIHYVCPWFVITCPEIVASTWDKIGNELSDYFTVNKEPETEKIILQYWSLLRDIIVAKNTEETAKEIVCAAKSHLEQASRECSRAPSRSNSLSHLPSSSSSASTTTAPASVPDTINPLLASKLQTALKDLSGASRLYPSLASAPPEQPDLPDAQAPGKKAALYHGPSVPAPPTCLSPLPPPPTALDTHLTTITSMISQLAHEVHKINPTSQSFFPVLLPNGESLPLPPSQQPPPPNTSRPPPPPAGPRTRSRVRREREAQAAAETAAGSGSQHNSDSEGEEAQPSGARPPEGEMNFRYETINKRDLNELLQAVKNYGTQASYTISCLESLGNGGALLPCEWKRVVSNALPHKLYLLWETDFYKTCRDLARGDKTCRLMLSGSAPYDTMQQQRTLPLDYLTNTGFAAMKAWRNLPKEGDAYAPLGQITQGPDETYNAFISRLLEAVERIAGTSPSEMTNTLVKHLAYENANAPCKALLKGRMANKTIHDMIDLCHDVDPIAHRVAHAMAVVQNQSSGKVCYSCGQAGHFVSQCPQRLAPVMQTGTANPCPPFCPRCRRGRHWVADCHAVKDVDGNPLQPNHRLSAQGNSTRGRLRAPRRQFQRFVLASEPTQPAQPNPAPQAYYQQQQQPCQHQPLVPPSMLPPQQPPLSGQPRGAQDWTCTPPPHTY